MNNKLLWLDDIRDPFKNDWVSNYVPRFINRSDDIVWVINYEQFINWITDNGLPEYISFDNDLGEEKEGYDCAKWLVDHCLDNNLKMPNYSLQTHNTVALENIDNLLKNFIKYN